MSQAATDSRTLDAASSATEGKPRFLRGGSGLLARIALSAIVVAVGLAIVFGVLFLAILTLRDRSVESAHTQQVIATANRLQTRVIDLETSVRGFVISKNTRDLGRWSGVGGVDAVDSPGSALPQSSRRETRPLDRSGGRPHSRRGFLGAIADDRPRRGRRARANLQHDGRLTRANPRGPGGAKSNPGGERAGEERTGEQRLARAEDSVGERARVLRPHARPGSRARRTAALPGGDPDGSTPARGASERSPRSPARRTGGSGAPSRSRRPQRSPRCAGDPVLGSKRGARASIRAGRRAAPDQRRPRPACPGDREPSFQWDQVLARGWRGGSGVRAPRRRGDGLGA